MWVNPRALHQHYEASHDRTEPHRQTYDTAKYAIMCGLLLVFTAGVNATAAPVSDGATAIAIAAAAPPLAGVRFSPGVASGPHPAVVAVVQVRRWPVWIRAQRV